MTIDLKIELSEWEAEQLKQIATEENISINQLVGWMVSEKLGRHYLETMAARGSREKYEAVLAKAPDVEPEPYDRLDDDPEVAREKILAVLAKAPDVEPDKDDRLDYEFEVSSKKMLAEEPDDG